MKISNLTDKNKRSSNQDSSLILPKILKEKGSEKKILLAMIADGMGGTDAGGIASGIVKQEIGEWFEKNIEELASKSNSLEEIKNSIYSKILEINTKVYDYGEKDDISLGSTIALLVLFAGEYFILNVGDSRVYKFGPSRSVQITKDQTVAQQKIDEGLLTAEEAKTDRSSHVLTQCIGMSKDIAPDFFKGKYKKKDYFLICSDGMYNRVDLGEMESVVREKKMGTKEKLTKLAILSKEKEEGDNITGVLIEC